MAVTFVNSGTFSGVQPGPVTPGAPASLVVGNLLLAQIDIRVGGDPAPATCAGTGWTTWFDDAGPGNTNGQFVMYRWVDGTEGASFSFSISGVTTNGVFARVHQFSGCAPGSGTPTSESGGVTQATTNTVSHVAVTTTKAGSLAIWFDAHADDSSTSHSIGGASGGTWVERTEDASSVGGDGRICFTTADMASPGTISGGTGTMVASNRWISRTFALNPPSGSLIYRPPRQIIRL